MAKNSTTLCGINRIAYNDKKTGQAKNAIILHVTQNFAERDVNAVGVICKNIFCSDIQLFDEAAKGRIDTELVGKEIVLFYDENKFLTYISLVK